MKEPTSRLFKFTMSDQAINTMIENLEHTDPKQFVAITQVGIDILGFIKEEDLEGLKMKCEANEQLMPYLKRFILDAFLDVLHLKYTEIIEYFLQNGLQVNKEPFEDCIMTITRVAKYLADDPPFEILELLIEYGAKVDCLEKSKYRTPLIKACKHGNLKFVQILVENGAEINVVDKNRMLPLNYTEKNPQFQQITDYLKSKGAVNDWRKELN